MNTIKQDTIDLIISEEFGEIFWYFELGRLHANIDLTENSESQFMNSFLDKGKEVWDSFQNLIKDILCDASTHQPKEAVKELTEGDLKDLVVNIIGLLLSTYSITIAIATPLTALILKKGIKNICS